MENQTEYSFKYKDSRKITEKYESQYFFDYVKISEDSIYNYSKLIAYKNKSKKKIVYEIELKIRKDKSSYFSLFRFCMLHTYEYETAFNFEIGGIIETAKATSDQLISMDIVLTNFEDLSMSAQFEEVKIPAPHHTDLAITLENGLYNLTIRQLFDPQDYTFDPDGEVGFEIVVQKTLKETEKKEGIFWWTL